jgi:hypothetical protein
MSLADVFAHIGKHDIAVGIVDGNGTPRSGSIKRKYLHAQSGKSDFASRQAKSCPKAGSVSFFSPSRGTKLGDMRLKTGCGNVFALS